MFNAFLFNECQRATEQKRLYLTPNCFSEAAHGGMFESVVETL